MSAMNIVEGMLTKISVNLDTQYLKHTVPERLLKGRVKMTISNLRHPNEHHRSILEMRL